MIELTATLVSVLSVSVVGSFDPTEAVSHLQWLHVWLPHLGVVGMGLRGLLGGDDDDDDETAEGAVDDPLGYGFGGQEMATHGGFDDTIDDGLGGGYDPLEEVEPRIDDVEGKMEELESTVSAVRGDQEAVQESLDEIEGNVRKLLEVYEVVTQGMNPFADTDAVFSGGANAADGSGAFGFLEEEAGEPIEDLPDEDDEPIGPEELFEGLEPDEPDPVDAPEEAPEDDGLTFDDLKSEFDFVGDDPEQSGDGSPKATDSTSTATAREKPYLQSIPTGFGSDLLIVEWLDYLVAESSIQATLRAIQYYTTMEWIDDEVADHLGTMLTGISAPPDVLPTDGGHPVELTVDHHLESLEYISQLRALDNAGPGRAESAADRVAHPPQREEDHGVQR